MAEYGIGGAILSVIVFAADELLMVDPLQHRVAGPCLLLTRLRTQSFIAVFLAVPASRLPNPCGRIFHRHAHKIQAFQVVVLVCLRCKSKTLLYLGCVAESTEFIV